MKYIPVIYQANDSKMRSGRGQVNIVPLSEIENVGLGLYCRCTAARESGKINNVYNL